MPSANISKTKLNIEYISLFDGTSSTTAMNKFHCGSFTQTLDACCKLLRLYQHACNVACYIGTTVCLQVPYWRYSVNATSVQT